MSNHVSDEERYKRINLVYECIKEGMSTRECAEFLTLMGCPISNVTVKDYIDRMMSVNMEKYKEMKQIMESHKPQTIQSEEVRTRVKNVVVALNAGYTFEEIAKTLGESIFTVYRDYTKRISYLTDEELGNLDITKEMLENINNSLKEKSMENLKRR